VRRVARRSSTAIARGTTAATSPSSAPRSTTTTCTCGARRWTRWRPSAAPRRRTPSREGTGDPAVTAAALRALGEANPNRAFDAAWGLLQNRDPLLASSAVETIGQLRGARRDDGLFIALEHPDPDVVKSALVELSRDMSPRTIARVGTCLDCASYEIRRFAAELLGSSDDPAAELLIRARLDRESDPVVREALNLALVPRGARGAGV
jgi:HEAT repeat protein